jgi:hypothetical protein
MAPPPIVMLEMITEMWATQAIAAAADLGIADALAKRGRCRPISWRAPSTPTLFVDC